jgi:ABC-type molybdate transport system permease subunit
MMLMMSVACLVEMLVAGEVKGETQACPCVVFEMVDYGKE